MNNNIYDETSIEVLEGLEPVRKRPGMYIGGVDSTALHHLVFELIDNSVDEAINGYAKCIKVLILKTGEIEVEDDGRGIPVGIHPTENIFTPQLILTKLHSGGKFDTSTYKFSSGLHGVGASVVNALSKSLFIYIHYRDKYYEQEYTYGIPNTPILSLNPNIKKHGTKIRFFPDNSIFPDINFSYNIIKEKIEALSFLVPGLKTIIFDERVNKKEEFIHTEGIVEMIKKINTSKEIICPIIKAELIEENFVLRFAAQYNTTYIEEIYTYVNTVNTIFGGTHYLGFKSGILEAIQSIFLSTNTLKNVNDILYEDIKEGLVVVLSIEMKDPQFEGQTKRRLGNTFVRSKVHMFINDIITYELEKNPKIYINILNKILLAKKAREAAKESKELIRKKKALFMNINNLPNKLTDCSGHGKYKCELYIVEGLSAGGTAKQGRDRNFQAILELRGKVLNVEKCSEVTALKNMEIQDLILSLGCGINENINLLKLRYDKIILMADADIDGAHIRILLLTFFFRYMKEVVIEKKVYLATPPLYRLINTNKKIQYIYDDLIYEELIKKEKFIDIQRYKGLGEMDAEQLWETTMNPETRTLKLITVQDLETADKNFRMLMGNISSGESIKFRKEFIEKYIKDIYELDI